MRTHASADLALAAYLDELARDRRVLWIGDPDSGAPERLSRSARSLRVLAPEGRSRDRERGRVRVGTLRQGALSFRGGSFDLVVVPDLVRTGLAEPDRVEELRAALADDGALVAGAFAGEPSLTYEGFFELLAERFDRVRMVGQLDFHGYALVDFESGEGADVGVDGSLVDGEETMPLRYVALGSAAEARDVATDAYCIVQVPGVMPSIESRPPPPPRDDMRRIEERIREAQREVDAANEHSEALEAALAQRTAELESVRDEIDRLDAARDDLNELRAEHMAVLRERDALERELRDAEKRAKAPAPEEISVEYARAESALFERARAILSLEAEVERRGVLVRDLVEELGQVRGRGASPDVGQLIGARDAAVERALEAESARAEAAFRIDELSAQLRANGSHVASAALSLGEATTQREVRDLAARVGDLSGQLVVCRERSVELNEQRDQARAENLRLTAMVSSLEDRAHGARRGYTVRIAELLDEIATLRAGVGFGAAPAKPAARPAPDLDGLHREIATLRGERDGLRLRLAERERALAESASGRRAPEVEHPQPAGSDDVASLQREIEGLRRGESELTMRAAEAAERIDAALGRAADLQSTIAARDALVTRLQIELAAEEQKHQIDGDRLRTLEGENRRLREAIVDASERVGAGEAASRRVDSLARDVERLEGELASARDKPAGDPAALERAESELTRLRERRGELEGKLGAATAQAELARQMRESAAETLGATRAILARLLETLGHAEPPRPGLAVEGEGGSSPPSGQYMPPGEATREIAVLHDRVARLTEDLAHEREERRVATSIRPGSDDSAELQRLGAVLSDREKELLELRTKATSAERDLKATRAACGEIRAGLEELLGSLGGSTDPEASERVGLLLRLLGRV